ncbi:MAG: hypothetical protein AB7P02_19535 [Alphaproteobacteria bacterium]
MVRFACHREVADGRIERQLPNGTRFHYTPFLGYGMAPDERGPVGYLIEQEPNSTIRPHFHQANQFQVIVAGGGHLGKQAIQPVTVHFAAAWTPYGPILSQEDGLFYFTLRDAWDPGARFMPESRADLPKVARRHVTAAPEPSVGADALRDLAAAERRTVVEMEDDGLGAWIHRVPPGGAWEGPDPATGGGQFHLLLAGEASVGGRTLDGFATIHVGTDDPAPALSATAAGAEVLVLQFPRRVQAA